MNSNPEFNARGRTRTGTIVRSGDFKSPASTKFRHTGLFYPQIKPDLSGEMLGEMVTKFK